MPSVDGSISSLIQGVSQQPDRERLPGQCELQENFTSDPVNGLTRRGPLKYLGLLIDSADAYKFDDYDGSSLGHFIVGHKQGEIKTFNLDATENTVTMDPGTSSGLSGAALRFEGVDEDIYVVDPTKKVAMLSDTRDYIENGSLVFLLGGQYGRNYEITVDWQYGGIDFTETVSYETPDGSAAAHIENISTTYIAEQLETAFGALTTSAVTTALNALDTNINTYQLHFSRLAETCASNDTLCQNEKAQVEAAKTAILSNCAIVLAQLDVTDNLALRNEVQSIQDSATAETVITEATQTAYNTARGNYATLINAGSFTSNFTVDRADDVLYIRWSDSTKTDDFSVTADDGDGGTNMLFLNNTTSDVGDLPRYAPHGYVTKVEESAASADDWYLEFIVDDPNVSLGEGFGKEGAWVETVAPGVEYKIDPDTMPFVLTKAEDSNDFTFSKGEWGERAAGDDDTNPLPTFVGNTLTDVGTFQGRLAFTSGVNVILSRTNKPTEYFNQSATTLADDDPIDIASSFGTYELKNIVPHNRDLVLFSDDAQFILFGRAALTPQNSSLVLTTEFETDLRADPVGAGRNIFFPFQYGQYTGIQEFFTEGGEDINDARPVTQHVLQYIEGNPVQLESTTNFNKLLVRTDHNDKDLYVYEYTWVDRRKAQSSWSRWTLPRSIQHMFFVNNLVYIITRTGTRYELYTLDLDDTPQSELGYRLMLDEQLTLTGVSNTFSVPYSVDSIENYVAVQGSGCPNPGMRVRIESFDSGTVTLSKTMQGGTVYFGKRYTSRYIPTSPFVRDQDGVKIGSGKLTIKQYVVHFDTTGYFKAVVTDDYGYMQEVEYNGRVLSSPSNLIGKPVVTDGAFRVPYKKNADTSALEITSDSHLPCSIVEMEWLGQWRKIGRRIAGG